MVGRERAVELMKEWSGSQSKGAKAKAGDREGLMLWPTRVTIPTASTTPEVEIWVHLRG